MRRQYIFLLLIAIILYISYLIIDFKYKEYKLNGNIEYIVKLNKDIENRIILAQELIDYKTSNAYKNRILKEQQWFKNIWENVLYLMLEEKYNRFTQDESIFRETIQTATLSERQSFLNELSIPEKWIYFIFKKEVRL